VPFDIDRLTATGPEVLGVDGVLWNPQGGVTDYAVSDGGTLVYTSAATAHRTLAWIDRSDGTLQQSPAPPGEYGSVSVAPDGRRVATFLTRRAWSPRRRSRARHRKPNFGPRSLSHLDARRSAHRVLAGKRAGLGIR
jgi:hypothetical protein